MQVDHLLRLDRLDLTLIWGDDVLLGQEIGGVTATDLKDPARFLQAGEIVLSGLVWWGRGGDPAKTDRFVNALQQAGAVALLAGEETHGEVPSELADACRRHRIALLGVPAHTSFRAITEAVYLRQWGEFSRRPTDHYALPENVRLDLDRALERGAPTGELLDRAFAYLGTPACHLLTSSGRTVARTANAPELPVRRAAEVLRGRGGATLRVEADDTAFDSWHLYLPENGQVPPRVLHEIAELLGRHRRRLDQRKAARKQAHEELMTRVSAAYGEADRLEAALRACGLAGVPAYTVVVATLGRTEGRGEVSAVLTEALHHQRSAVFAVAELLEGEAVAVLAHSPDQDFDVRARLAEVWSLLHDCRPGAALHAGVSDPVSSPVELPSALAQARYALAGARTTPSSTARVAGLADLAGLRTLLPGIPSPVRRVYLDTVLGPLLRADQGSRAMLLETLEVFLDNNCSWARTAEALHLHVNTVHYRIERIERLIGRNLSRLDDKLDVRAALLCR
ncbi:Transcriptional regulator [Streptomyces venezuelae]|uniref:PucR family transcriptional regulator n=1 Tax=Streptomyces gardneri TaxID=66892 RepID=UPI0006BDB18D|nr:PucR family transcriptional regulator [Streptomyces gardneri]ALO06115.1 Transcriptional regulator [Streptomyces venezuelae]QPK43597.1 helix-turn-helix domain-containing protein [Streptomyces gardneri]WRK34843.1 helix-turn-helix domain-containing protein [Streptomyces venezuelae]CUM43646.1 transcriptional regulator [Streptomyces venezuelae]